MTANRVNEIERVKRHEKLKRAQPADAMENARRRGQPGRHRQRTLPPRTASDRAETPHRVAGASNGDNVVSPQAVARALAPDGAELMVQLLPHESSAAHRHTLERYLSWAK